MGNLIYIIAFFLGLIIVLIIHHKILVYKQRKIARRYKKIINEQNREIGFLKRELEEIETRELFN